MRFIKDKTKAMTRREFLKFSSGCATLSSISLFSTMLNLQMTKSVLAATPVDTDYKALVCVFLLGGNDSFNMLAPYELSEYTDYAQARGNLALQRASLLSVTDGAGRQFGLHPGMPELMELYSQGKLGFVANVGTLIEPTTLAGFNSGTGRVPLGLFSHNDQQQHWQTSVPQSRFQLTGWAGRMADAMIDLQDNNSSVSMNISLNRENIFQVGDRVIPYIVGDNGAKEVSGYGATNPAGRILTRITDSLLGKAYPDLLEQTHADIRRQSIDSASAFNAAVGGASLVTSFPSGSLGAQLGMVAKAISARGSLGQSRQIFFVSLGGWDHHDDVLSRQSVLLPEVSAALKAFHDATVELGVENNVTTFTASEFGRTLSSNGNGSDHGWGGNQIVMGGSVAGGHVYGNYPPSLALGNLLDTGRGRLIPTTSVDEFNAELAMWMGIGNDSNLELILPNIRNFYPGDSADRPIGFMS